MVTISLGTDTYERHEDKDGKITWHVQYKPLGGNPPPTERKRDLTVVVNSDIYYQLESLYNQRKFLELFTSLVKCTKGLNV